MKPFNLELAKQGHPVCTREERPARILCFDRKEINHPIVALITGNDGVESIFGYTDKGCYLNSYNKHSLDLFMAKEKKNGWINIYTDPDGDFYPSNTIYDNEHEAEEAAFGMSCHVDTIQIEFEI